ncbi:MAG: cytochrome c [Gammaproteobacteria bacterium]|nr:cytochrome c [Gammaproteobacteria bacterium]
MTVKRVLTCVAVAATLGVVGSAIADQPFETEIEARQGQFKLLAFNLGPLVGMARGDIEYDAATAQASADNIAAIASLQQDRLWPAGSDSESVSGTRALPEIWEDTDDVMAKFEELRQAALAMQEAAGSGLDGVRGQLRTLGAACSSCHDAYRESQ